MGKKSKAETRQCLMVNREAIKQRGRVSTPRSSLSLTAYTSEISCAHPPIPTATVLSSSPSSPARSLCFFLPPSYSPPFLPSLHFRLLSLSGATITLLFSAPSGRAVAPRPLRLTEGEEEDEQPPWLAVEDPTPLRCPASTGDDVALVPTPISLSLSPLSSALSCLTPPPSPVAIKAPFLRFSAEPRKRLKFSLSNPPTPLPASQKAIRLFWEAAVACCCSADSAGIDVSTVAFFFLLAILFASSLRGSVLIASGRPLILSESGASERENGVWTSDVR